MNKIYLAISKGESLVSVLNQKFPDSEVSTLDTKEQVTEILKSPFQLLITSTTFISNDLVNNEYTGDIIILDPNGKVDFKKSDRIYVYKDLNAINIHIITKPLENTSIQHQPGKEQATTTDKNPTNEGENKVDTPSTSEESNSQSQNNISEGNTKLERNSESNTVQEKRNHDANSSKPINMNNYPQKDTLSKTAIPEDVYQHQQEIFNGLLPGTNKTIGVWSPLSLGITTFVINFAIYLSEFVENLAVVELPNRSMKHKSILERYQSMPTDWVPFIDNWYEVEKDPDATKCLYKGIQWFPLGEPTHKWDVDVLCKLLFGAKQNNLVFIDFPSKEIDVLTKSTLSYLNELWILIDDDAHVATEWKKEIHRIKNEYPNLTVKLIFNWLLPHSRPEEIAHLLELKLIGTIPAYVDIFRSNHQENKPPIELYPYILAQHYRPIAEYLLGKDKVPKKKFNAASKLIFQIKKLIGY